MPIIMLSARVDEQDKIDALVLVLMIIWSNRSVLENCWRVCRCTTSPRSQCYGAL
ncbi:MAG: hypothetical protein ACSLEN_11590 [Candidatus Malihini olakiniferum]